MSTAHHHAHGGPDHVPHVTPLPVYLKTFGALLMLTAVTVGVSYVNLGSTVNLIIALIIATIKAVTVAALFMHLYADHKFHSIVFGSSVVFLLVFVSFTMFDTEYRHRFGAIDGERINMNPAPSASASASAEAAPAASAAPAATPSAKPATSAAPPPTVSAAPAESAAPATSASAAPSASAMTSSSAAAPASAAPSAKPAASAAPAVPAGPTPHH